MRNGKPPGIAPAFTPHVSTRLELDPVERLIVAETLHNALAAGAAGDRSRRTVVARVIDRLRSQT